MTVGFFGPGYETTIYEYDSSKVTGFVGESVDLRFLETTQLPPGKVMLYRPHADVHAQYPPSELSISLNLMVRDATEKRDQFCAPDLSRSARLARQKRPHSGAVGHVMLERHFRKIQALIANASFRKVLIVFLIILILATPEFWPLSFLADAAILDVLLIVVALQARPYIAWVFTIGRTLVGRLASRLRQVLDTCRCAKIQSLKREFSEVRPEKHTPGLREPHDKE
jgi:hypothetical protein